MIKRKGVSISKKRRFSKYITLSQLPSECRTDSTICGNFLLKGCFLKEVVDNGGIIQEG
jgi:hypothetical protein